MYYLIAQALDITLLAFIESRTVVGEVKSLAVKYCMTAVSDTDYVQFETMLLL